MFDGERMFVVCDDSDGFAELILPAKFCQQQENLGLEKVVIFLTSLGRRKSRILIAD